MKKTNKCLFTVCIVHYRKLDQLKKTVDYLFKNTKNSFQLNILNQGYEKNGIKSYLENLEKKENVSIIFTPKNIGVSKARTILSKKSKTPFLLMLDDDMYLFEKNWDIPILKYFEKNKTTGAIGFSIYKKNKEFWSFGGRNIAIKNKKINISYPLRSDENLQKDFIEVDDIISGSIFHRKELLKTIKWDPFYFIGFEDFDKGIALKNSKYKCFVSIKSKIIHDKISTNRKYIEYNKTRRDYHSLRREYLYFIGKNNCQFKFLRHVFYKYICLILPNFILRNIAYLWLNFIKNNQT